MRLQFLSQQLEFGYCHVSLSAAYICILFSGTQTDRDYTNVVKHVKPFHKYIKQIAIYPVRP